MSVSCCIFVSFHAVKYDDFPVLSDGIEIIRPLLHHHAPLVEKLRPVIGFIHFASRRVCELSINNLVPIACRSTRGASWT